VAQDNKPPAHLAHLAGTGISPSKMVWATRFTRRGNNTLPELWAEHSRPFGLVKGRIRCAVEDEIIVLPSLGQIRPEALDEITSWLDEDYKAKDPGHDELAQLRPYRWGDCMRTIHWRASARMQQMLVTERHNPHAQSVTICLDTYGPSDRRSSRFERLISATATVIDYFCEKGWRIKLVGSWLNGGTLIGNRDQLLDCLALVECNKAKLNPDLIPRDTPCLTFSLDESLTAPEGSHWQIIPLSAAEELVRMGRHIK
jgi:uncharacterized protein (DUF58 family)